MSSNINESNKSVNTSINKTKKPNKRSTVRCEQREPSPKNNQPNERKNVITNNTNNRSNKPNKTNNRSSDSICISTKPNNRPTKSNNQSNDSICISTNKPNNRSNNRPTKSNESNKQQIETISISTNKTNKPIDQSNGSISICTKKTNNCANRSKRVSTNKLNNMNNCSNISINESNTNSNESDDNVFIENEVALKQHFHSIHNMLYNYGIREMNAFKLFSLFYSLKILEGVIKKGIINLPNMCLFSELVLMAEMRDTNKLASAIFSTKSQDNDKGSGLLEILWSHEEYRHTIFHEVPRDIKINMLIELIKMIDIIDVKKYDVAGRTYEYFIGRNKKEIGELGAYYTHPVLVDYIVKKVNPYIKNNKIPDVCDPFCGSGRFLTSCINNFKNQIKCMDINVNWAEQLKYIHGYDTNEDMVKSCNIELLSLTSTIPYAIGENGICAWRSIGTHNSFIDGDTDTKYNVTAKRYEKYDYIFSNPPYGANNIIKHIASTGILNIPPIRDELNNIITVIKGDDKETLSLLLFMGLLKLCGTAVVVLKEGVFFNKKYTKLRKLLCENYNVTHIMSVPQDDFWNTNTKTSMLIFHNNGKTNKIVFSEINYIVDKNNNKEIIFETHPMTKDRTNYLTVEYQDIVNNNYSLHYTNYWKDEIKVKKGFKIIKLESIIKFT